jgi:hypothetical protein
MNNSKNMLPSITVTDSDHTHRGVPCGWRCPGESEIDGWEKEMHCQAACNKCRETGGTHPCPDRWMT